MSDSRKNLEAETSPGVLVMAKAAGELAGVMALRLAHDHLLRLNADKYKSVMRLHLGKINSEVMRLQEVRLLTCTRLNNGSFPRRLCLLCVGMLTSEH